MPPALRLATAPTLAEPRPAVEMVASASRRAFLDKTGMCEVAFSTAQREHVAAIARKPGWKLLAPLELRAGGSSPVTQPGPH